MYVVLVITFRYVQETQQETCLFRSLWVEYCGGRGLELLTRLAVSMYHIPPKVQKLGL